MTHPPWKLSQTVELFVTRRLPRTNTVDNADRKLTAVASNTDSVSMAFLLRLWSNHHNYHVYVFMDSRFITLKWSCDNVVQNKSKNTHF